jgi:hypothetical protein
MLKISLSVWIVLICAASGFAQTGNLRGQVKDDSGAVVPSAKVDLAGPGAVVKSTVSDGKGSYSFTGLAPGSYTVQASAPSLAQEQPATVNVKAGTQTLDLRLTVAKLVEQVTVQDTPGAAVSTSAADNVNSLVLQGQDLDALSDDPDDLQADLQALAGPSAGPGGGSIYIDGFSSGELPPKSSIREVRINQNPFSPEYDKLGYGRIEIFTKPGSDRYRATVNYNLGTKWWNSRNPFSAEKAPFLLNEFEGDAGGPLGKKASFLVDAQHNSVDNGSISNGVVLDPTSLTAMPFNSTITTPQVLTRVSPRVDYQLNDKNTLTFRYGITHASIQDAGIGALDLTSRGYHEQYTNQTAQAGDTVVLGNSVNETRFQFYRAAMQQIANSNAPTIEVLGSFNGGGSQLGRSLDTQNNYELQNYTTTVHGAHTLRYGIRLRAATEDSASPQDFNGTFIFGGGNLEPVLNALNQPTLDTSGQPVLAPISSIERYRRTLLFQALGDTPAQIRALGGGATQFTQSTGLPNLSVHQFDGAVFGGDEWRAKPNLTVNLGFRYEAQTNIHDWRDIAPRLGIAWAPGRAGSSKSKTVLRVGFGMFYQRFPLTEELAARRYNGSVQQQYVVQNPDFFPSLPSSAALTGFQSPQVIEEVSSQLRTPYIMQSAVTWEQQLPGKTTFALTYTNAHSVHQFMSNDINAPLPGTYNQNVPGSGIYPLGKPEAVFLMESSGLYNQNQIIANVNARLSSVSLFGFYVFNKAMSNTDGFSTFPANPYSSAGEYGPAATDVRHRFTLGGSMNFRWNIRLSPFIVAQTGTPFDITSGTDIFGTTLFNARPALATDPNKSGLIATPYGLLDPTPSPGETVLTRNSGRGPAQISLNLRIGKTIGFGSEGSSGGGRKNASSGGGSMNVNPTMAASGRGIGGLLGTSSTSRRYNLTISMSIRNLLNHTNPGPIIGDITSPLFGRSTQIAGTPNGEGFYETANNRRLELQIRFTF